MRHTPARKQRMVNLAKTLEKAQKASYLVAQRIAKSKKPHTIAQELILSVAVEMCEVILGTEAANKLKAVPLSNDTVRRRIEELSADIQSQLLDRLRSCEQFSIQLDESTDIASAAKLFWFANHGMGKFWRTFCSARRSLAGQQVRKYSDS